MSDAATRRGRRSSGRAAVVPAVFPSALVLVALLAMASAAAAAAAADDDHSSNSDHPAKKASKQTKKKKKKTAASKGGGGGDDGAVATPEEVAAAAGDDRNLRAATFGEIRACDACLVLGQELLRQCARTKPKKLYAEGWVEDMKDTALQTAVRGWVWSQPKGYTRGYYRTIKDVEAAYKDSPESLHHLRAATKHTAKLKDTKRANLLLALLDAREDDLDLLLMKCAKGRGETVTYKVLTTAVCTEVCHEGRYEAGQYPDPGLVEHIDAEAKKAGVFGTGSFGDYEASEPEL